jgi:hypothetical protein
MPVAITQATAIAIAVRLRADLEGVGGSIDAVRVSSVMRFVSHVC